jgi:hypothetical protein
MRLLRLPPPPKSRHLFPVPNGTACAALPVAIGMGNFSTHGESRGEPLSSRPLAAARTGPNGVLDAVVEDSGARGEVQVASADYAGGESISAAFADFASDNP